MFLTGHRMWKMMKKIQKNLSKNKKNKDITMAKQRRGTGFWYVSSDKIDTYILRNLNTTDYVSGIVHS